MRAEASPYTGGPNLKLKIWSPILFKDQFASNAPGDEAVKLAHDWLLRLE
jgi:hypothetical protein